MKEKEGTKTVARVEVFNFSEKSTPVRVQVINGEPWFVAKDIAEALGYSNPRKAINDHCKEKGVTFRDSLTEGGVQKLKYINEVLARKIWLYGATQPGWFATLLGVRLLLCASAKRKVATQLTLEFKNL